MSKRSLFSLILLGILGILSIWAFIISKNIMRDIKLSEGKTLAGEEINMEELIITETKNGEKFWEVYADSGYYDNETNIAILKDITGNFYKEGEVNLSVASPIANYDSDKKQIILKGGAQAVNINDVYIKAEEICWTGSKNEIEARGNVRIIREENVLTVSDRSVFDTDFTNLKISGDSNTYVFSLH